MRTLRTVTVLAITLLTLLIAAVPATADTSVSVSVITRAQLDAFEPIDGPAAYKVGAFFWCDQTLDLTDPAYQVVPTVSDLDPGYDGWVGALDGTLRPVGELWVMSAYGAGEATIDLAGADCGADGASTERMYSYGGTADSNMGPGGELPGGQTLVHYNVAPGNGVHGHAVPAVLGLADGRFVVVTVRLMTVPTSTPFDPETGDQDPAAAPDQGVVSAGTSSVRIAVLDNDLLPNGATSLEIASAPSNGTATVEASGAAWSITYEPREGFVGQDTFGYRVTDTLDRVSETTVVVDVLGDVAQPPAPPVEEPPAGEPPVVGPPVLDPPAVNEPGSQPAAPEVVPFAAATGVDLDAVRLGNLRQGPILIGFALLLLVLPGAWYRKEKWS